MTNGKRKGKDGELELARLFRDNSYIDAKRSQQFCGKAGDADVIGVPNLHIEVKRRKVFDVKSSLTQAKEDAKEGTLPVVFHRGDRKPWIAVMEWEVFEKIYKSSDKLLRIIAKSNKNNLFYKWLEMEKEECSCIDSAVGNMTPDGHFVFMYFDAFIEMFRNSEYGG